MALAAILRGSAGTRVKPTEPMWDSKKPSGTGILSASWVVPGTATALAKAKSAEVAGDSFMIVF
jgi:hypothetical protein